MRWSFLSIVLSSLALVLVPVSASISFYLVVGSFACHRAGIYLDKGTWAKTLMEVKYLILKLFSLSVRVMLDIVFLLIAVAILAISFRGVKLGVGLQSFLPVLAMGFVFLLSISFLSIKSTKYFNRISNRLRLSI